MKNRAPCPLKINTVLYYLKLDLWFYYGKMKKDWGVFWRFRAFIVFSLSGGCKNMAIVSVVMGSDSDLPVMSLCLNALEKFQIPFEVQISSAHRVPEETAEFARRAAGRGIEVIVAGAGGAAHLAGVIAALRPLPVIAVPISSSPLRGIDALYAMVQMPRGIPVATVAVDGAYNAGLLAAQICAVKEPALRIKIADYKNELARGVREKNEKLQKSGYRQYLQYLQKNRP